MEHFMRGVMRREKNMERVDFAGQMDQFIRVTLIVRPYTDKEFMNGLMAGFTKVNGRKTKWMEKENFFGRMEENILVSIKTIKNMGTYILICKHR